MSRSLRSRSALPASRRALRSAGRALAVLCAASVATLGPVGTASAATCGTGEGFSRLSSGSLYRLEDKQVLTGTNTLAQLSTVGAGWGGFAWTGAGGDGVVYALTTAGKLLWYRYDAATSSWAKGSGTVVGTGFTPGTKVVNIAIGANGWLYTVRKDGRFALYQHTGRLTGTPTWVNGTGYVVGSGWTANEIIAPQGDGTIYRQVNGNLYWFRHTDPTAGPVTWSNGGKPVLIGSGWRFYDLLALGSGVLLATSSPSGQVSLYAHRDPVAGGQGWTVTGLKKYVARSDSYGVTMGPDTCRP